MSAVAVFVGQTSHDDLDGGFEVWVLCEVAVVGGDDDNRLVGIYRVPELQRVDSVVTKQMTLAPWCLTIPIHHFAPLLLVTG